MEWRNNRKYSYIGFAYAKYRPHSPQTFFFLQSLSISLSFIPLCMRWLTSLTYTSSYISWFIPKNVSRFMEPEIAHNMMQLESFILRSKLISDIYRLLFASNFPIHYLYVVFAPILILMIDRKMEVSKRDFLTINMTYDISNAQFFPFRAILYIPQLNDLSLAECSRSFKLEWIRY